MNTYGERLEYALAKRDMSQAELARQLGTTSQAVNHLIKKSIRGSTMSGQIAKILQISETWLSKGIGPWQLQGNSSHSLTQAIPLISPELFKGKVLSMVMTELEEKISWTSGPRGAGPATFAIIMVGNSMVSPSAHERSIADGSEVYVDPDVEVRSGLKVLAALGFYETPFIRTYREEGDRRYLVPLNPQYPVEQIDHNTVIHGVVIGSYAPEPI